MDFAAYFETLARKLKDVKHTNTDRHYIKANGYDNMSGLIEHDNYTQGTILVCDVSAQGRFMAENSDQILERCPNLFYILQRCNQNEVTDQENTIKQTKAIAKKVIAKMLFDQMVESNTPVASLLRNLDNSSFFYQSVGPIASSWYGTIVQFSIVEKPGVTHNPLDWDE